MTVDRVDALILTAADGEDEGLRAVTEGRVADWSRIDAGPPELQFPMWVSEFSTSDNGRVRIGLARAFQMGVEASVHAAAILNQYYRPRCLAMCGVCAGRPGWVELGDVIVADRVYRYDVGEP